MQTDQAHSGFAFETPYAFAGNTPIQAIDKDGEKIYFVNVNGAFVDAEKTLLQTASGRAIFSKYYSSTTHDIYINLADFGASKEESGSHSSAVGFTQNDVKDFIHNSKLEGLGAAYREGYFLQAADAFDSFEGLDISKSKGRKV